MEAQFPSTISIIPYLPKSAVSTGYSELQVTSAFDPIEYPFCKWKYTDQTTTRNIEIFSPNVECEDRDATPNFPLFCAESEGIVNSTLTLMFSLQSNFIVSVECANSVIESYETITSTNVIVASK